MASNNRADNKDMFSSQEIEQIVYNTVDNKLFTVGKISVRPANKKRLGFICDHFRLSVEVKFTEVVKTYNYFLKCIPTGKDAIHTSSLQSKEIKIYEILKLLSTNLGKQPWYSECYFSNKNAIVFEDLSERGFTSLSPRAQFTKDHYLTALTALAKLHASCISFEEKRTKELGFEYRFEIAYEKYLDTFFYNMSGCYAVSMEAMLAVVETFSKYAKNQSVIEVIKQNWTYIWSKNIELVKPSTIYRNVMVQRDLWGGNLMYRYENGVAKECIVVDYQTFGWQPPAFDVMSLIYINTPRDIRSSWESELINHYYNEFKNNLLKDDVLVENILTKDDFLNSCKFYSFCGLMHSCFDNHMIRLSNLDEVFADPTLFDAVMNNAEIKKKVVFKALEEDIPYREFIVGSLEELIEKYILTKT